MIKNKKANFLIPGLLLTISLTLFLLYANSQFELRIWGIALKKNNDLLFDFKSETKKERPKSITVPLIRKTTIDSTKKRFLLIGDSQIEGLRNPFYDYCIKNGHELALAMIWYSSTDMTYGNNDTLKNLIAKYNPNHIVFVIGLNQIYQTHFESSEKSIENILKTFDTIPYSWIGPANWTEDKGINSIYSSKIDSGKLFLSKNLILERANDGRHPSNKACFIWMDSIADWMQNKSVWHIKMNKPDSVLNKRDFKLLTLTVK
jgi:hypothetical protein